MVIDERVELGWAEETDWTAAERTAEALKKAGASDESIQKFWNSVRYDRVLRTYEKIRGFEIAYKGPPIN